jgi:WD40 repeat protein
MWNTATGDTIYIYRGDHGSVHALAWSPDGKRLASSSKSGNVQVWQAI